MKKILKFRLMATLSVACSLMFPVNVIGDGCDCGCCDEPEAGPVEGDYANAGRGGDQNSSTDVSDYSGIGDSRIGTFAASRTSGSVSIKLRQEDGSGAAETASLTGSADGSQNEEWVWDGPPGEAPGVTYEVHFEGSGVTTVSGSVTNNTGSTTASASSDGSGSASGCDPRLSASASLSDVSGSASYNTSASYGGGTEVSPVAVGVDADLETGSSGAGAFARTGTWSIDIRPQGCLPCGGTTIGISSSYRCAGSAVVVADGSLAYPTTSIAEIDCSASMDFTVSNVVRCNP